MATDTDNKIRIILIGTEKGGKSKTGNTILGSTKFAMGLEEGTQSCEKEIVTRDGYEISVIDTPRKITEDLKTFVRSEIKMADVPTVFLFCVPLERLTNDDVTKLDQYVKALNDDMLHYTMVIFTKIDKREEELRKQLIDELPHGMRDILKIRKNMFFNNSIFKTPTLILLETLMGMRFCEGRSYSINEN